MRINLFLFLLIIPFVSFCQEVETIKIVKKEYKLYQGVLKETKTWYLFEDLEGKYYLANIDPAIDNIDLWFKRFKNSMNIYKTINELESGNEVGGNMYRSLVFVKDNDPENRLSFYIEKPNNESIVLISLKDNSVFMFDLLFD